MERNLATIQKINDIKPIENADSIEVATVLGWHVVIKKEEFKIGDKVVYCEIDSILPDKPEFEFLRERKFRIKTIKLRGQVSQGIIFPLSVLPEDKYNIDDDVTDIIGIKKYDSEADDFVKYYYEPNRISDYVPRNFKSFIFRNFKPLGNLLFCTKYACKKRPEFIYKTGEERIQNLANILEEYAGQEYIATEKIDGTSSTFYLHNGKFGICTHNRDITKHALKSDAAFMYIAKEYKIEEKMRDMFGDINIAIQGEIIGPNIQNNKYKKKVPEFYVFNIYNINGSTFFTVNEAKKIISKMNLNFVPIAYDYFTLVNNVDEIVEMAKGKSQIASIEREGIVVRRLWDNITAIEPKHISFKVINPSFLLKFDE